MNSIMNFNNIDFEDDDEEDDDDVSINSTLYQFNGLG